MSQPHQPLSFLSLPVEIRLQIYQHLITTFSWGSALHINLTSQFNPLYRPCPGSGQLTYLPCLVPNQLPVPSPMSGVTNTMDLFRYHTHYETCRGWHIKNGTAPALQGTYLSIFLTCRTIHSEGIHLLYKPHAFTLQSLPALYQFLTTAPLTSLNYLKSVTLNMTIPPSYLSPPPPIYYHGPDTAKSQWITSAFILTRLPLLSSLKITIWNTTHRRFLESEMLLPLSALRLPPSSTFTIRAPFQDPTTIAPSPPPPQPAPLTPEPDVAGVGMKIERRPRNHEPVTEPAFQEMNAQVDRAPSGGRRRRRRCADFFDNRFYGEGWWPIMAWLCCSPLILFAILWDLVVGIGVTVVESLRIWRW